MVSNTMEYITRIDTMNKSLLFSLSLISGLIGFSGSVIAENDLSPKTEDVKQVQQTIDINSADVKQLALLKGVGLKRAKAIVEYREANGEFASLEDLLKVKGIGESVLEANQSRIKI